MAAWQRTGFDTVQRVLPSGELVNLSKREFESMPLSERVRAILGKQLRFFRNGKEISHREALGGT